MILRYILYIRLKKNRAKIIHMVRTLKRASALMQKNPKLKFAMLTEPLQHRSGTVLLGFNTDTDTATLLAHSPYKWAPRRLKTMGNLFANSYGLIELVAVVTL